MIRRRRYEISIPADKIVEGSRLLRARARQTAAFAVATCLDAYPANLRDASINERCARKRTLALSFLVFLLSPVVHISRSIARSQLFAFSRNRSSILVSTAVCFAIL